MALVVYKGPGGLPSAGDDEVTSNDQIVPSGKRFVGLANQGATCYLNGLIQTLFMTPEFRKAIFSWNYDVTKDGDEDFCIPLQLQKLFGMLQLSSTRSVDTVSLTKSFGWEGSEVFQQQDVQELSRVLFDALEESFRGTPMENVIDDIYAGELIDYLRCIDVDYKSERKDKFLDFSLAIIPFGESKAMKTLNECIELYLRPEILDGDNKYYAEEFDRKVDAIKGLKFGKLSQILSIQLKRFVYDFSGAYVTQRKINDEIKFPMILDMNKYVAKKQSIDAETGAVVELDNEEFEEFLRTQMSKLRQGGEGDPTTADVTSATAVADDTVVMMEDVEVGMINNAVGQEMEEVKLDSTSSQPQAQSVNNSNSDIVYGSMTNEEIAELISTRGEWIYELYAVLIHSGAITGGHYYAYIKDLSTKKWYNFNDSMVTAIDEKTVQESWGGRPSYAAVSSSVGYYPNSYANTSSVSSYNSANGYMMLYRKINLTTDIDYASEDLVPSYIREMIAVEEEKRIIKQREEEELRNRVIIKINWKNQDHLIPTKRNERLDSLLSLLWERFDLGKVIFPTPVTEDVVVDSSVILAEEGELETIDPELTSIAANDDDNDQQSKIEFQSVTTASAPRLELIRLREYNQYNKLVSTAFESSTKGSKSLADLFINEYRVYTIETRQPEQEWEEYFADGLSVLIEEFDGFKMGFKDVKTIRLPRLSTLGTLRERIAKMVTYNPENIRILKIINLGYNESRFDLLANDQLRLKEDLLIYDGSRLYVEDASLNLSDGNHSIAFEVYMNTKFRMEIHYNRPPESKFDYTIVVDGRWKIPDFRQKIADEINLPIDQFRMFKTGPKGIELKDADLTLTTNGVHTGMNLYIASGKPTPNGWYVLIINQYTPVGHVSSVMQLPEVLPEMETVDIDVNVSNTNPWGNIDEDDVESNTAFNKHIGGGNGYQSRINMNGASSSALPPKQRIRPNEVDVDSYDRNLYTTAQATAMMETRKQLDNDRDNIENEYSHTGSVHEIGYQPLETVNERNSRSEHHYKQDPAYDGMMDDDLEDDNASNEGVVGGMDQEEIIAEEDDDLLNEAIAASLQDQLPVNADASFADFDNNPTSNYIDDSNDIVYATAALPVAEVQTMSVDDVDYDQQKAEEEEATMTKLLSSQGVDVNADRSMQDTNEASSAAKDVIQEVLDATVSDATAAIVEAKQPQPEEEVEPSDFGERMVKNTVVASQFTDLPELTGLVASGTTIITDLRQQIADRLIESGKLPVGSSPNRIRIRDKVSLLPGKILRDGKTFMESQVYLCDSKNLCIEILDEDEILPDDDHSDVVVLVQKWHRSTWSFSERIEILFPGSKSVRDIAIGLSMVFSVDLKNLRVLVVPKDTAFYISDLTSKTPTKNYGRSWFDPSQERKLLRYVSHDMRLAEGDLLLVQDCTEPLMKLSPADLKSMAIVEAASHSSYMSGPYPMGTFQNELHAKLNDYASRSGTHVPSWAQDTNNFKYDAKYPTVLSPLTGRFGGGGGGGGIRIKTHKDRIKEAEDAEKSIEKEGEVVSTGRSAAASSVSVGVGDDMMMGRTSPVDFYDSQEDPLDFLGLGHVDRVRIGAESIGRYAGEVRVQTSQTGATVNDLVDDDDAWAKDTKTGDTYHSAA